MVTTPERVTAPPPGAQLPPAASASAWLQEPRVPSTSHQALLELVCLGGRGAGPRARLEGAALSPHPGPQDTSSHNFWLSSSPTSSSPAGGCCQAQASRRPPSSEPPGVACGLRGPGELAGSPTAGSPQHPSQEPFLLPPDFKELPPGAEEGPPRLPAPGQVAPRNAHPTARQVAGAQR